ncbi:ABC transporter permease [Nonomuraea africana]|uniref:Peptide/nickel transport system permease protein n=1 Tax=Nonomuraea africana TaxID=46171 RepID=A0ABR9K6E7_9ACTN|nr:ABC transporter permease [Nonomuraea africana]MBE1557586.1 peptide/nickel transport system permease protein [Nonomuraea africana]
MAVDLNVAEAPVAARAEGWWRRFRTSRRGMIGLFLLGLILLMCVLGPAISAHDPAQVDPLARLASPRAAHWFGTDQFGRDVLTRMLAGGRVSLMVAAAVTVLSVVAGCFLGLLAAMYARADGPMMRVLDALMAFPSVLLAIALMARLGPSLVNVIVALSLVTAPTFARLVRGSALVVKSAPYVELARALGLRLPTLMVRYLLANSLSPLILAATFGAANVILAEASLSFLGAGLPTSVPTWGSMLNDGQTYLRNAWWLAVAPGLALTLLLLALNMMGDALRDALDPRSERL